MVSLNEIRELTIKKVVAEVNADFEITEDTYIDSLGLEIKHLENIFSAIGEELEEPTLQYDYDPESPIITVEDIAICALRQLAVVR